MIDLVLASLLLGFATFRAWRVLAKDSITEPIRAQIIRRSEIPAWRWILELITCPWCLGFWIAGMASVSCGIIYHWSPLETILVWLASSGLAGLLGAENTGKHS